MNRICLNERITEHLGFLQSTSGKDICRQLDDCVDLLLSKYAEMDWIPEQFLSILTTVHWAKQTIQELLPTEIPNNHDDEE